MEAETESEIQQRLVELGRAPSPKLSQAHLNLIKPGPGGGLHVAIRKIKIP